MSNINLSSCPNWGIRKLLNVTVHDKLTFLTIVPTVKLSSAIGTFCEVNDKGLINTYYDADNFIFKTKMEHAIRQLYKFSSVNPVAIETIGELEIYDVNSINAKQHGVVLRATTTMLTNNQRLAAQLIELSETTIKQLPKNSAVILYIDEAICIKPSAYARLIKLINNTISVYYAYLNSSDQINNILINTKVLTIAGTAMTSITSITDSLPENRTSWRFEPAMQIYIATKQGFVDNKMLLFSINTRQARSEEKITKIETIVMTIMAILKETINSIIRKTWIKLTKVIEKIWESVLRSLYENKGNDDAEVEDEEGKTIIIDQ